MLMALAAAQSTAWYLHIVLYLFITPPPSIFLNALFIELDRAFTLFGTVAYGCFSFYLLACLLKGCMQASRYFFGRKACTSPHPSPHEFARSGCASFGFLFTH